MPLKIIHLSHVDNMGGAALAAFRTHNALCKNNIDSALWVNQKNSDNQTVFSYRGPIRQQVQEIKRLISGGLVSRVLKTENKIIHSPQLFSSDWPERINKSSADIVNLHWVCNEMLSIKDIGKITKPLVWTFHDMWPACGAEHYTLDERWRTGYNKDNRPVGEARFDLNRFVWNRKVRNWKKAGNVVAPSIWLSEIATKSVLFKDWETSIIQYPIDTAFWRPINKKICRNLLDLPKNLPLIAIGNEGGNKNLRKGFDLFIESIKKLKNLLNDFGIIIFGQKRNIPELDNITKCFYLGHLNDEVSLRMAYSAADVFALPSKMDNLPLTVLESQSCNTPVVLYCTSGQQDLIIDADSGFAVEPFDTFAFAKALAKVLKTTSPLEPRRHILINNKEEKIAKLYVELYSRILKK